MDSAQAAPAGAPHSSIVAIHMRDHYEDLQIMQRHLIDGDLPTVRDYAFALALERADAELAPWAMNLVRMRQEAELLGLATGTAEAARQLPLLVATCADCHRATGAELEVPDQPVPTDDPTALARMDRHQWAADRMWFGLIASSDQAWRDGLDVLARTPLPTPELSTVATPKARPRIAELGGQLQRLAKRARTAVSLEQRAIDYGEMLVVCAGCHELAR